MKILNKFIVLISPVVHGKINYERLGLYLLLLTVLVRFYKLSGGIVLGEPDEVTHQEIVNNFHKSWIPQYSGGPWYYELPLYPFLGFLLSFVFPQDYLALRLVSLFATALLIFGIYFYIKNKVSTVAGFWAALIFSISPMAMFYSRVGMLDATVVSFSFMFLIFFDLAHKEKKLLYSLISGVFLGAAILTKYSALVFVAVPVLYFIYYSFIALNDLRRGLKPSLFEIKGVIVMGLVSAILIFPVALFLIASNKHLFKIHLLTNLGLLRDTWWVMSRKYDFFGFITLIPWWLSLGILLLLPLGIWIVLKTYRKWVMFLGCFLILLAVVVTRAPFYPRYFYLVVPFIAILGGLSLELIVLKFPRKLTLVFFSAGLFLLATVIPVTGESLKASHHVLIEESANYVRNKEGNGKYWVFSTYWPNFYTSLFKNVKVGWLADSAWEASAFVDSGGKSSLDILKSEGGAVLIEDLYSGNRNFKNPSSRTVAREQIIKDYKPVDVIYDRSSNFPHFKNSLNTIKVYVF